MWVNKIFLSKIGDFFVEKLLYPVLSNSFHVTLQANSVYQKKTDKSWRIIFKICL